MNRVNGPLRLMTIRVQARAMVSIVGVLPALLVARLSQADFSDLIVSLIYARLHFFPETECHFSIFLTLAPIPRLALCR